MSFKSSQGRSSGKELEVWKSSVTGQGIGGGGGGDAGPGIAAITATGGTITTKDASDGKTYKIHTFTTPGPNPFSVSAADPTAIIYLTVAGGGGGGGGYGYSANGVGGGSGNLTESIVNISVGSYDINIGNGGSGGYCPYPDNCPAVGGDGGSTSFTSPSITITAGGGTGGSTGGATDGSAQGGPGGTLTAFTPADDAMILSSVGVIAPGVTRNDSGPNNGPGGSLWTPSFNTPYHFIYPRSPVQNKGNGGSAIQFGGQTGQAGFAQIFYQIEPS